LECQTSEYPSLEPEQYWEFRPPLLSWPTEMGWPRETMCHRKLAWEMQLRRRKEKVLGWREAPAEKLMIRLRPRYPGTWFPREWIRCKQPTRPPGFFFFFVFFCLSVVLVSLF